MSVWALLRHRLRAYGRAPFRGRILLAGPVFGMLALPTLVTNDPVLQLSMIAGTGLLSALAYPLWLRGLTSLHEWNRYAMLRGFRASGE